MNACDPIQVFSLDESELREDFNSGKIQSAENAEFASYIGSLLGALLPPNQAKIIEEAYAKLEGEKDFAAAKEKHLNVGREIDKQVDILDKSDRYQERLKRYEGTRRRIPSLRSAYRRVVGPEGRTVLNVLREREIELRLREAELRHGIKLPDGEEEPMPYTWKTLNEMAFGRLPHEAANAGKDRVRDLCEIYELVGILRIERTRKVGNAEYVIRFTDNGLAGLVRARQRAFDISSAFIKKAAEQREERLKRFAISTSFAVVLVLATLCQAVIPATTVSLATVTSTANQMGDGRPKLYTGWDEQLAGSVPRMRVIPASATSAANQMGWVRPKNLDI